MVCSATAVTKTALGSALIQLFRGIFFQSTWQRNLKFFENSEKASRAAQKALARHMPRVFEILDLAIAVVAQEDLGESRTAIPVDKGLPRHFLSTVYSSALTERHLRSLLRPCKLCKKSFKLCLAGSCRYRPIFLALQTQTCYDLPSKL